jgi:hypothetical protein
MHRYPPTLGCRSTQDAYGRLRDLFRMENELINEEIAIYKQIAEEESERTTNRLRKVLERDNLMRRLQILNDQR